MCLFTKPRIQQSGSNLSSQHIDAPPGLSDIPADALVLASLYARDQAAEFSLSSSVLIACAYTHLHEPMRLLQYSESEELSIHSFDDGDVPRYAILSHTWGADGDEVTFADLETGHGKAKPAYEKILFCGRQARHDGLEHFWIDTCCIDTTDKAEHSWAIRSMFRWYRFAAKCYVYLSDVSINADGMSAESSWEPVFRSSRWFTRGWTLQELLAPTTVEFFSQEGEKLGDKVSLTPLIHRITSIPPKVLSGAPLSQSSINDRWRWAEGRKTRCDEDRAYSLQGIFDVELAPVYGEGESGAFDRLKREIYKLERCMEDMHSTDPRDDKKRIEDTKGGLLTDSYRWVLNNTTFRQWHEDQHSGLLWVKGDPGKGKTMLLCGIIDELQNSTPRCTLLSYFFCQATDSRINSATAVLRGLLYMLVDQQPSLAVHVRRKHDRAGRSLFNDANAWVALTEIFVDVIQDTSLSTTYLIIDALDECVTDQSKLLTFIAEQSSVSSRVKWIVSSRNWPAIEEQLERAEHKTRLSLELNAESVATAVKIFIQQQVCQLAQEKRYTPGIQNAVLQHLRLNANDTFLWVALVCQDLKATPKWNVLKKLALFPPGLDSLYRRMLLQISESDSAEICLGLLAVTSVLYRPVIITELVALAEQIAGFVDDLESVREIIGLCGSFLTLRDDTVYFVHQSAKDFLFAKALNEVFPDGTERFHRDIFAKSLTILHKTLHRDMYNLQAPGHHVKDVKPPLLDPLAVSRYPCVYWIDHLYDSGLKTLAYNANNIDMFLRQKYLYWLEALSLCRSMAKGVVSITKLWHLVQKLGGRDLVTASVQDAQRFILYHKNAIESYPLQAYTSALLFSPPDSLIRSLFQHEELEGMTIKPVIGSGWSACLQTLEGHTDRVNSLAFSHDSTRLASASRDSTVKIWDASSGTCLHTLKGYNDRVISVTFSHDSTQLASASDDSTVKIWDVRSGTCLYMLKGHSRAIESVAFSHDSIQLASASSDMTVKIWDASSGACLRTLKGHSETVTSIAFSHDSNWLASASDDSTVKIWDVSSGTCLHTLKGHSEGVQSVAFSHNSNRLASTALDNIIRIWDASSGTCLHTLKGHIDFVQSAAFSHDSTRLASASDDSTVKIWDASSGACLQTFKGHGSGVNSVAFSHDSTQLASASSDMTVKIWDASSGTRLQTLEGHTDRVNSLAFSHDLAWLASSSFDNTVSIWDASNGTCLYTLESHSLHMLEDCDDYVQSVAFSHDSACLALASTNATIRIWDVSTKTCLHTLKGHIDFVQSTAFSHDSTRLASASDDSTVKLWDVSSGTCLHTLKGHSSFVKSAAFSHDSTRLASASYDSTVKIWDASSGACLQTFKGHGSGVNSVAFSHDSTQLASASSDMTVKIWDASSGTCLHALNVISLLSNLSFDSTGAFLYTDVGTIIVPSLQVLDTTDVAASKPRYKSIGLNADRTWITRAGSNIVWIPSEYRPFCSAVSGAQVGMGVGSGGVWFCKVDE